MTQSAADSYLFYSKREKHKLIVALNVNDGLVANENEDDFAKLVADMKSDFQITVSPTSCFLRLQIMRQTDSSMLVTQASYTKKILEKFNMLECNKVDTSMNMLCHCEEKGDSIPVTDLPYREANSSLMYLATSTRPDIMFAVSYMSQALNQPAKADWDKVKRVFRYLKGMVKKGILFDAKGDKGTSQVV